MLVKRIALVILSLAFGFAATHFFLWWMNTTPDEYGLTFGTDGDGLAYYPLTIISFAFGLGIWLDKWMSTELLPH